ncbi:MAG: peptide-methionine (S)-S-oxide reductase MsrA [Verrucomicrobia bacterium]|nr:peptide-methionine (S)-S-oxide reductase MsrA [Verrucomicrobiota bacterium]MBT7065532.1 peptide-methionine (S)-S-oxide reductase MsrA [Verrucomicrobiota bacterium]
MEREGVAVSEDGSSRGGTPPEVEVITLGAGCFWCTEAAYQLIDGVTDVQVGYMGGATVDPTYKQVCSGRTGHAEVAQITFDPSRTRLDAVLDVFWVVHNPTTPNRQGADVGSQYRSAIFYHAESQKPVIQTSLKKAQKALSGKIVTEIAPAVRFYAAENYHQDYYSNNPDAGYCRAVIAPKLKKVKKRIGK